ncbi:MAG: hypothetical protein KC501_25075 [Myxococcales bacterium]|nr:hypothetical protein [Myxococcales bacterium]
MTPAGKRIVDAIAKHGEAWVVPAQHRLVHRLQRQGLVVLTDERRPNALRGSTERRVVAQHQPPTEPQGEEPRG